VTGLTEEERAALLCDCADAANSLACPGCTPSALHLWTEKPAAEILAAAEAILAARLAAHEAREAELIPALEAGDACGAVGCRALAERDALLAQEARVRALADEWDMRGREAERYINRAHHTEIHEVMAEARWFPERATELRDALDGPPA